MIYESLVGGQYKLYSVNANDAGTVALTKPTEVETFGGITPGGRVIYTKLVDGIQTKLYSVSADGTGTVALTNSTEDEAFSGITPSGRVIYQMYTRGQYNLYSVNADGTGTAVILADTISNESYSGSFY